jgi:hypothetical protein
MRRLQSPSKREKNSHRSSLAESESWPPIVSGLQGARSCERRCRHHRSLRRVTHWSGDLSLQQLGHRDPGTLPSLDTASLSAIWNGTSALTANGEVPERYPEIEGLRLQFGSGGQQGAKLIRPGQATAGLHLTVSPSRRLACAWKPEAATAGWELQSTSSIELKAGQPPKSRDNSPDISGIAPRTSTGTGAIWQP